MADGADFVRVIIPLAVEGLFTYRVPPALENRLEAGMRVLVPFGKKRIYTAVVHSTEASPPEGVQAKEILDCLDDEPVVNSQQLQLWNWVGAYYMSTPGDVMRAALPSGFRPESESRVRISPDFRDDGSLDHYERLLYEVIREESELSMTELEITGISANPLRVLKQLVDRGAVELNEFVHRVEKLKKQTYIRLGPEYEKEEKLLALLDKLGGAPKQLGIMERFLQLMTDRGDQEPIPRKLLIKVGAESAYLNALVKKQALVQFDKEVGGNPAGAQTGLRDPHPLNEEQSGAIESIRKHWEKLQTVLLHGVTSSGKTEIYIHLIKEQVAQGKQVLYLLPEIALTTQIIARVREVFGGRVGVYHSRYSDRDRVHVYRNLLGRTDEEPCQVVVGVRSALFLPFRNLGLVIIDEAHENTFKQFDPAPRYHARDSAQVLALYYGAKVLMGTATPSYESFFNAQTGKYGYVQLKKRFGNVEPPEVEIANTREAMHRKQMVSHFTPSLMKGMEEVIARGEQVILFQNRRGYSPYIICKDCGEIPKCRRCDVSLTFHRSTRKLECHYCGHSEPMPSQCPACASTAMQMKGFGTEKIEEELALVMEGVRVGRLDTDTARSRQKFEKVLEAFGRGDLDVLVGTQMVSKGLDFDRVSLVGILDADSMLHFPDFRAFERSYQLIAQVSGRAGRRKTRGKVVVQTMDPEHPVIQMIRKGDFEALYREQMEERQIFHYPPYTRMIRVTFRHKIPSILDGATAQLATALKEIFGSRVLGPQYPPVMKVYNNFIKHIYLKVEKELSYEKAKSLLAETIREKLDNEVYRSVRVAVDVDPY